jgi:hypothetical protein
MDATTPIEKPATQLMLATNDTPRPKAQWRRIFLDKLAETSNVSEAARAAHIEPARAYKIRREETEFRREWYDALLEGYEHLEMEMLHRLRVGTGKDDNKFDFANALRLLMLHRETVARERALRGSGDKASVLASLNAKIDLMREREAEVKQMLLDEGRFADNDCAGDYEGD